MCGIGGVGVDLEGDGGLGREVGLRGLFAREGKPECATFAVFARYADFSAHEPLKCGLIIIKIIQSEGKKITKKKKKKKKKNQENEHTN
jgi:hypothetical protein